METAGKLVDEEELREAMKDSGIGTPATRAAIIERLLQVGYIERDARALVVTEKGLNVIRLLGEHPLTSPGLTGDWEQPPGQDRDRARTRARRSWATSSSSPRRRSASSTRSSRSRGSRGPTSGPCPVCGRDIVENRKGYSCWSREDPGCGFVIWKAKAGKQLPLVVARELIKTGRTEKPVTGFKGRSGKSFRARLALMQNEEGKWRVEFDEPWAKEGAKPPVAEARRRRPRPARSSRGLRAAGRRLSHARCALPSAARATIARWRSRSFSDPPTRPRPVRFSVPTPRPPGAGRCSSLPTRTRRHPLRA